MISTKFQQNIITSIALKEFKGKDENFVREEFLVPIFKAAGYDAFGVDIIARGVNLSRYTDNNTNKKRQYIYPDFVLYKNKVPLWVIDAKSPKTKVNSNKNIEQIFCYCRYLNCKNAILSNAVETYMYSTNNNFTIEEDLFTLDDVCSHKFDLLIELLRPETVVKRIYTFDEAVKLYGTDDYVDRSFLMKLLQIYNFDEIESFLKKYITPNSNDISIFRYRALPSILITKHAKKNIQLFKTISNFSLSDPDCIVRENFLTCLICDRAYIQESDIIPNVFSMEGKTFLEKILHITFLSTTTSGKKTLKKGSNIRQSNMLKEFSSFLATTKPISFPIALPLKKPIYLNHIEYTKYLKYYPRLIEGLEKCPETHPETFKVINDCLKFAKNNNKSVFKIVISESSKKQKGIIEYLSSDNLF